MNDRYKNTAYVIIGGFLFGATINLLILPIGLYNGGFTGIALIMRDILIDYLKISPGFEVSGIITFLLNIPIIIFAYKRMSRRFVINSLLTMLAQTITMTLLPIPTTPLITDTFITIIMAAGIGAWGIALAFKGRGSGGGLDIIGIYYSQNNKGSVGKIYNVVNFFIYLYCLVFYNLEIAVYSFVYSMIFAFTLDKFHHSNIEVSVMVFTHNKDIKGIINKEMRRGATYWQGYGSYTDSLMEVFVSVVSQDEVEKLKTLVHALDPKAFIIITENLKVVGGFEKRLI